MPSGEPLRGFRDLGMSLSSIQDVYVFEQLHGGGVWVNKGMIARVFVYVKEMLSESGLPSGEPLGGFAIVGFRGCGIGGWPFDMFRSSGLAPIAIIERL